jgi:TolB protein
MTKSYSKLLFLLAAIVVAALTVTAQQRSDLDLVVTGAQQSPRIAVPDMQGTADSREHVATFNNTLWNDLNSSAQFEMVSKSLYPRTAPRRQEELQVGDQGMPGDPGARGLFLSGWALPPVQTHYLAFGEIEVINGRLALSGYLYDATAKDRASGHIFAKRYFASLDAEGARQLAHDFSRDILQNLGLGLGLAGSRIYFVSDRSGFQEIWSMDYDGSNQKQITHYKSISFMPAISPEADLIAFTTYVEGLPKIYVHALETNRRLTFYNQNASLNATPSFSPDGKKIAFASTAGGVSQIYLADLDGRNLRRISYSRTIDVDPAINPRTGAQLAFVSGRTGIPQVYVMDIEGANVRMLSQGGGDAVQPSWDTQGENVAFAWTRGFEPGNYNVFIANVATGKLVQLTHGAGRNENPSWAPSGTHMVFSSNRSGGTQIWTMRADGTQVQRLTSQGRNFMPVWGKK